MRDLHASQIKVAVEAVKARKEVNEVYFVACGGSQAVLMAGQYMFCLLYTSDAADEL